MATSEGNAPHPLANQLRALSGKYTGSASGTPQDILASAIPPELLAQLEAEGLGGDELAQYYDQLANPLIYASLSTAQRVSLLPGWAQDLKVLGLGKETDVPEMLVFMRDTQKSVPENRMQFDTPQGLRSGATDSEVETTSKAQTVERALNQPYLWDEEELDEAMKKMQDAGYDVKSFDDANAVWQSLVDRAAKTYTHSKGEKKVTPWDVLDLIKREDETANGGEDPDNFTHVSTSKSIQDISEGEAWSTLQSNLSRMLGRDPSDQEVRDFTHRMNTLAARNPAISKTISTYKDGRLTNSTTREVESGFTADDMAMTAYESAQADPEYGAFTAASTYYNAAVSALGAIGDV